MHGYCLHFNWQMFARKKIAMNGGRQYLRAMTGDMRLAMRYDNLGYMGFQN